MAKRPENSTSERALSAAGAALDLLDAATSSEVLRASVAVEAIATVIHSAGDVRPYQREELVTWLGERLAVGPDEDMSDPESTG